MCILFIYTSTKDTDGDYSLILASNRDEYYDRPALPMAPWEEDPDVFGGNVDEVIFTLISFQIIK